MAKSKTRTVVRAGRMAPGRRALKANLLERSDLKFWISMYRDPAVSRQIYAAPGSGEQQLWSYLTGEYRAYTVTEGGKRVGGFLLGRLSQHIGTFTIVLARQSRGRGYGPKLMRLVELHARRSGFRTLRADVYSDNDSSLALLRSAGFREFVWLEKNLSVGR